MNKSKSNKRGLVPAICGSLFVGLPFISLTASTESVAQINPCPGIYYEEPYNTTRIVPEGCPPNAATQRMGITAPANVDPSQPPLPENRSDAIARVEPVNGMVSVKLINNTNTIVSYEAVAYTERDFLGSEQETVLRDLPTPVTITMVRQDDGWVQVNPVSSSEGMLVLSLEEDPNPVDDSQGVIRIQEDGQVFLN